jgi:hypothetical protein
MAFYANDSVAALANDILLKCGKLYAQKYLVETTGTMGTPGAAALITLTAGVASDDLYNNKTLFIQDNNSKLCKVNIDDSATAGGTVTVDTTSCLKVEDELTAGSWTAASTYNLYILDTEEFVGYSTQSLDYEEETVEFLDCNERVREDISKVVMGFSGECKNFSSDKTFANVYGLTQYGSQTSQKQYHGGFQPPAKTFYKVTLKTENVVTKAISISFFKGSFFSNGAVDFGAAGEYKVVPYKFNAFKDELRDGTTLNAWSITEAT